MRTWLLSLIVLALVLSIAPTTADARKTYGKRAYSASASRKSVRSYGVQRDARGRIKRSSSAKQQFRSAHPCPSTGRRSGRCPGYVIDHIHPLKRGGADSAFNMQWQTREAARLKDRWE